MGLIYASGDSANLMNVLTSNLDSAATAMAALKSGSRQLTEAIDGKTLSGAAYEAGKGLFENLVIPTIERVQNALEDIRAELSVYKNADGIVSGEGYLDEDNLKEQINIKKDLKTNMEEMADQFYWWAESGIDPVTADRYYEYAGEYDQMADSLQDDIDKLQDKIDKLYEFSDQVNGLFCDSLAQLDIAMQGVKVLNNTTINSNMGIYELPRGTDKSWFSKIHNTKSDHAVFDTLKQNTVLEIGKGKGGEEILGKAMKYGEKKSSAIWKNRYSIKDSAGKILGKTPGATLKAEAAAEVTAENLGKYGGKALMEGAGTFIAVGIDIHNGDKADEAWGKEITNTAVSVGVGVAVDALGIVVFGGPVGAALIGGVLIGTGVSMLNDELRKHFKGVKDFEDNIGKAVVSGWNSFTEEIKHFF